MLKQQPAQYCFKEQDFVMQGSFLIFAANDQSKYDRGGLEHSERCSY
jgi:hypothetical protein